MRIGSKMILNSGFFSLAEINEDRIVRKNLHGRTLFLSGRLHICVPAAGTENVRNLLET